MALNIKKKNKKKMKLYSLLTKSKESLPTKKQDMVYQSVDSLKPVVKVVNDASEAIHEPKAIFKSSTIPEVIVGAICASIGACFSLVALYCLGRVGFSASGITSGLAKAGSIVGGGMLVGVFVLASPIVILAACGVGATSHKKNTILRCEKERLYKSALEKHHAIIKVLKHDAELDKDRLEELNRLNVLLRQAIHDLKNDLKGKE